MKPTILILALCLAGCDFVELRRTNAQLREQLSQSDNELARCFRREESETKETDMRLSACLNREQYWREEIANSKVPIQPYALDEVTETWGEPKIDIRKQVIQDDRRNN